MPRGTCKEGYTRDGASQGKEEMWQFMMVFGDGRIWLCCKYFTYRYTYICKGLLAEVIVCDRKSANTFELLLLCYFGRYSYTAEHATIPCISMDTRLCESVHHRTSSIYLMITHNVSNRTWNVLAEEKRIFVNVMNARNAGCRRAVQLVLNLLRFKSNQLCI